MKAVDVLSATTLQLLQVKAPTPLASSAGAYGVHALRSPGLRLEHVVVEPANAVVGEDGDNGQVGFPGAAGAKGVDGKCDTPVGGAGGSGGGSPSGNQGGDAGDGGSTGWGAAGMAGLVNGGSGGIGGASGNPGKGGADGGTGVPGATGNHAFAPGLGCVDNAGVFQPALPNSGGDGGTGGAGGAGGAGGNRGWGGSCKIAESAGAGWAATAGSAARAAREAAAPEGRNTLSMRRAAGRRSRTRTCSPPVAGPVDSAATSPTRVRRGRARRRSSADDGNGAGCRRDPGAAVTSWGSRRGAASRLRPGSRP